jgi:hypothetical protein
MTCEKCGHVFEVGDYPFCNERDKSHGKGSFNVQPDEIPGGVLYEHGICHADGTPKRYYSKSEVAHALKEKGLMNLVEHKGSRGSDKSPHTTRWV